MRAVGIICEYNPFHMGHQTQIAGIKQALGNDLAIVCAMSGNFVQRGEPAMFNKHARAETAVRCGADLVLEIPTPYVLSSSQGFAEAGVSILNALGACDYLSFGSESGDINELRTVADALFSEKTELRIKEMLNRRIAYAQAVQEALDSIIGGNAALMKSPNNLLGVEYIKAIKKIGSRMKPITIKRIGGDHDGNSGFSASAIRHFMRGGEYGNCLEKMPAQSLEICKNEISEKRGPISIESFEQAIMARLRQISDFSPFPGASEGFENRFAKYAAAEPTVTAVLEKAKTKRYAMSRLRRMLMCACLGITAADTVKPPAYLRVLAANDVGISLLGDIRATTAVPIITKPAQAKLMPEYVARLFAIEAAATDFYVLGYPDEKQRSGGSEWRRGPVIVKSN